MLKYFTDVSNETQIRVNRYTVLAKLKQELKEPRTKLGEALYDCAYVDNRSFNILLLCRPRINGRICAAVSYFCVSGIGRDNR